MRSPLRTCLVLVAGGALTVACGDPDLRSNLDDEGPPEVNLVTVAHEGAPITVNGGGFGEAPTFCTSDANARVNRELCPEVDGSRTVPPVVDAIPVGIQVRVVFSELLDLSVETLEDRDDTGTIGHIDTTLPVTLTCDGTDLTYDGYYDVSGSHLTAPPGPSLVVQAPGYQARTGSDCTITTTAVVTDKDNLAVSGPGPYEFKLAPLSFAGTSIEDGSEGVAIVDEESGAPIPFVLSFNAPIDAATITEVMVTGGDIMLVSDPAGTATPVPVTITGAGTAVLIEPTTGWLNDTTYALTFVVGDGLTDSFGTGEYTAPAADVVTTWTTGPAPTARN